MNIPAMIARETLISVIINTALSIFFFFLVFGSTEVSVAELGPDFLPQTFMIALMGSFVPSLLQRKNASITSVRPIVIRSFVIALVATAIFGGTAFAICSGSSDKLAFLNALLIKAIYGAALAAIVTPFALRALFAHHSEKPA